MKKGCLLLIALACTTFLQAQWVNDPTQNTQIATCNKNAAEVYVSTDKTTGDTYVQWDYQGENGWSPWLQRLNSEGVPQWPADGIHVTTPDFATWSPGYAMTAVAGGVVSVFRTLGPHHWAVKINADGTFPWGEHGVMLFNGEGGGRSEVLAGDDGGVWTLGTDMDSTFLQYVNPDGTLRAYATIKDPVKKCSNGILVPANDGVFVVYAKQTLQGYTNYIKEIYVAGYNKDGEQIVPETLLIGNHTTGASYIHYAVSDGMGGGYVYTWHNYYGGVYNTYVTHFDASGTPTIEDPMGIPVHDMDYNNFYLNAYPTIDPQNHDLIIAYIQKDSYSQSQFHVLMNRITATGERVWGEGITIAGESGGPFSDLLVDAFKDGSGFSVIYQQGNYNSTIEAKGFDMEGNPLWSTTMSNNTCSKSVCENTPGFHFGQNMVAWVNTTDGGVFGQNIGHDGTMGPLEPIFPPEPCDAPTNFHTDQYYDSPNNHIFIYWTAPETLPLHYNLYLDEHKEVIEIAGNQTSYYLSSLPFGITFLRLTAVYEECESDFALTPDGYDFCIVYFLVSVPENETEEEILTITNVYTTNGQRLRNVDLEELSSGVYLIQGWSSNGKLITKKIVIK